MFLCVKPSYFSPYPNPKSVNPSIKFVLKDSKSGNFYLRSKVDILTSSFYHGDIGWQTHPFMFQIVITVWMLLNFSCIWLEGPVKDELEAKNMNGMTPLHLSVWHSLRAKDKHNFGFPIMRSLMCSCMPDHRRRLSTSTQILRLGEEDVD
ncbi:hypothetical protein L1987_15378 [Smallanthus sonchifolius]|uniref:Uncharacterized protein n=1 Tax=Smallanthus sonchifolius TaxID=185202 RepID=A0ACB9J5X5_9ASTR|nr:hypothetical protein L1987_15378 [Smallanthus sonchifolius]